MPQRACASAGVTARQAASVSRSTAPPTASTVLQTMRLDLLKLRSNGLDTRLESSTGATQEARALSRDIGRAIEAADEVRKL